MTVPTTSADLTVSCEASQPMRYMNHRIRRCTGLSPSRASGIARALELTPYSAYEFWIAAENSSCRICSVSKAIGSDVQVGQPRGLGQELASGLGARLVHQVRHHLGGDGAVLKRDLLQDAGRRVHGRLAQFGRGHLAQALVALDRRVP